MKPATEHDEQVTFCQYLDFVHLTYFAVPNENKMSGVIRQLLIGMIGKARGMQIASKIISSIERKFKAEGKKKGVLDIVILLEGGKTVFIEMKRKKGGTVSKEQKEWLERLRVLGFDAYVCKGAKEAIEAVQKYLPESKKRVNSKQGELF